jgi:hypothetical protein
MGEKISNELAKADNFNVVISSLVSDWDNAAVSAFSSSTENEESWRPQMGYGLYLRNTLLQKEGVQLQIPFYEGLYQDCYSDKIIYLIQRYLKKHKLHAKWILAECNWIAFESIPVKHFEESSIRVRIYYAIKMLEVLIVEIYQSTSEYDFTLKFLKKYANSEKLGAWHYPYSEISPLSILNDEYDENSWDYITEDEFMKLRELYNNSDLQIIEIIDNIFEISTKDLYSSIINESQYTLDKLIEIAETLKKRKCRLPRVRLLDGSQITDGNGWGRHHKYSEYFD